MVLPSLSLTLQVLELFYLICQACYFILLIKFECTFGKLVSLAFREVDKRELFPVDDKLTLGKTQEVRTGSQPVQLHNMSNLYQEWLDIIL